MPAVWTADAAAQPLSSQGEIHYSLLFGAIFAFLAQLSSIGKGMQKVGVQSLPELSLRPKIMWQYATNKTWRSGFLLDALGAVFGFFALTILPISVAQPIFCNGLVLLALYSHFYLQEQLHRREWVSMGLCFTGTLLLALTLVPRDWGRTDIRWMQAKLALVLMLVLPLLLVFEWALRRAKRARGVPNRNVIELLTGLQAGVCIGIGNASLASGLQSTSKSWLDHVAREHVGSNSWPKVSLSSGVYVHLVLSAVFVAIGAALNALHPVFANRGYQHGRVVLISTHTSLVSMLGGVLVGIGVLDEAWPGHPFMSATRYTAFAFIISGVAALNSQSIGAFANSCFRFASADSTHRATHCSAYGKDRIAPAPR
jgi:multidrug transporter EmrE-like cation transporter